ncbi:hypothetical protein AMATHDRAFT_2972 [Amanita thiersii Skay4041]|uniref:Uncharacterized protein n=1 Tax=Amanita thiersii Skay4041 TaxID=703135 RepID=A0A2A9NUR2_9AGAR|nr:hypothetical protein AMATHDRAFT_2972 [Amanita thiersii Skay4041]
MAAPSQDDTELPEYWKHIEDDDVETPVFENAGEYSSRMEELFADADRDLEDQSDDEEFLYTGVDANNTSAGYNDQLRDILGPEMGDNEDKEVLQPEHLSLDIGQEIKKQEFESDIINPVESEPEAVSHESSHSSPSAPTETSPVEPPTAATINVKQPHPFLHPSVSRLRSYDPSRSGSRMPQLDEGLGLTLSLPSGGLMPVSSHVSTISHESYPLSPLPESLDTGEKALDHKNVVEPREVFKWTELNAIAQVLYSSKPPKASSVLGTTKVGRPTALVANGLICIGMDDGAIFVYDFKQNLQCICGSNLNAKGHSVGPVTALALSHDHTYVASGHTTGHIFLYNLPEASSPVRSVLPITFAAVASGRKEGHLQGSGVVSVGFIGGRHTALVSADEHGLAFYHNLGKVLFVEASDTLRILGRYPEVSQVMTGSSQTMLTHALNRRKARYTILAMAPLPLGPSPHITDTYQLIAMLTPTKLVVVGLGPSPKTWFKYLRDVDEGSSSTARSKHGNLAWYPSVSQSNATSSDDIRVGEPLGSTDPMLVYTWGNSIHLIKIREAKIKQVIRNSKQGKSKEVDVGNIVYDHVCRWTTHDDVLFVQWLNTNQLFIVTPTSLDVYEARTGKAIEHVPFDSSTLTSLNANKGTADQWNTNVAHSVRVYKSKIFLLGHDKIQVGTLMTWADQILSRVQNGDFLNGIEIARSFYLDEAPGNRNGLPIDPDLRRTVIGQRMQALMHASAQYAFSEERMRDSTHFTPDNRGVDRTSLFEGLVAVSCRACISLGDFEFLFEDLFQEYDEAGITRIYLLQLQAFVLDGSIHYVPPRITQRLIALHEEDGRPDYIERIIWHIDPACLDINQTIRLCQQHHLYDALIYVYASALRDYVSPIVEFLEIIRQKIRSQTSNGMTRASSASNAYQYAYKVYPYLETILIGHIYPSNEPLSDEDGLRAKKDIYTFLLSGRSCMWPPTGAGARLVLTSLEEGGAEPTYPYIRLLLRFDSEWLLHALDKALETAFLDDELQASCQSLIKILSEILMSSLLDPIDATFVRIFIARNVPKYPQFLHLSSSALHQILTGLAEDCDVKTREDRQLAAESLLSIYHPNDMKSLLRLFTDAGFYRILRQRYLQDRSWPALLSTYLEDTLLEKSEAIGGINSVFSTAQRSNNGSLPPKLMTTLEKSLPNLLLTDIPNTATLVNRYCPVLHDAAVQSLDDDSQRFMYLKRLLGPEKSDKDSQSTNTLISQDTVPNHLCYLYLSLQCQYEPSKVMDTLQSLPSEKLEWNQALQTCETHKVYDAVIWGLNWRHDPQAAIKKVESYEKQLMSEVLDAERTGVNNEGQLLTIIESVVRMGISVCLLQSREASSPSRPENLWLQLLKGQIYCIQRASAVETAPIQTAILPSLRALVQETFRSLVSITSARTVSFPQLFNRLVESVSSSSGTHYTEFRSILTGMLESYRSDGDMLTITKHLVTRDLFETVAVLNRERLRGWSPSTSICKKCRKPILDKHGTTKQSNISLTTVQCNIAVSRTGALTHDECS